MSNAAPKLVAIGIILVCIGGVATWSLLSSRNGSEAGSDEDQKQIHTTFDAYIEALLARNGEVAADLVDDMTIKYYDDCTHKAKTLGGADTRRLRPGVKFTVLRLRLEFRADALARMDGRKTFVEAVNRGWVSQKSSKIKFERIQFSADDEAAAWIRANTEGPPDIFFTKIDEKWKIGLSRVMGAVDQTIEDGAIKAGKPVDRHIEAMLGVLSGYEFDSRVWDGPLE